MIGYLQELQGSGMTPLTFEEKEELERLRREVEKLR